MHVLTAVLFGEFQTITFSIFPEVIFQTSVDLRTGSQWVLISGLSNVLTIGLGYWLLSLRDRITRIRQPFFPACLFYLTLLALIMDPINLSIGSLIYNGDALGISTGLGIRLYWIQGFFLLILLLNRELIGQFLFRDYGIDKPPVLFRPLIPLR